MNPAPEKTAPQHGSRKNGPATRLFSLSLFCLPFFLRHLSFNASVCILYLFYFCVPIPFPFLPQFPSLSNDVSLLLYLHLLSASFYKNASLSPFISYNIFFLSTVYLLCLSLFNNLFTYLMSPIMSFYFTHSSI